jgi:pyruvate formate lyase activating enzyme
MGIIFDIKRFALHDGPGLRTTVFLKGCPLSCLGCHNPEGQRVGPELLFRPDRCTMCGDCIPACPNDAISFVGSGPEAPGPQELPGGEGRRVADGAGDSGKQISVSWDRCDLNGACVEVCLPGALELVGQRKSVEEIMDLLESDVIYFDESRGGVTFSGGEPFAQPDFLRDLLHGCREREIPVVLDTCGHVAPETFRELAPQANHLLFDLKVMDEERHEAFTGVHNRWILENLAWLGRGCPGTDSGIPKTGASGSERGKAAGGESGGGRCPSFTVRIPLIPGVNDDAENLRSTASFLLDLPRRPPVDVLPYHRLGVDKYHRTGRDYHLEGVAPPPHRSVREAVEILENEGLNVTVRGERYGDD